MIGSWPPNSGNGTSIQAAADAVNKRLQDELITSSPGSLLQ